MYIINASGFRADIRYNNVFDRPEKTIDTIIVLYVYTYYFLSRDVIVVLVISIYSITIELFYLQAIYTIVA